MTSTTQATLSIVAFFLLAIIDWFAVTVGAKRLEYFAKPATLIALIAYAATGSATSGWLLAALVAGLFGDVFLMLPKGIFEAGLGSFLVGHIAYIIDFATPWSTMGTWVAAFLLLTAPVVWRLVRAVDDRQLRVAIVIYMLFLVSMTAAACGSGILSAAVGGILFLISDTLIGWDRFVSSFPRAKTWIHATYHLGQLGLVIGLRGV